jgi:phage major head subunit gpT-like protein
MIVNKSQAIAAATAFRAVFNKAFNGASESTFVRWLAQQITDPADAVNYNWLAAIPGMKELKGAAEIAGLELITWTVLNKPWHSTIEVKESDIAHDRLGLYNQRFEMMAAAGARHPDELAAAALLNGFTAKDYTGTSFFNNSKKHFPGVKAGATFDNKLELELTSENYNTAVAMLQTQKIVFPDNSEIQLNLGKDLVLVCGPNNRAAALKILNADTVIEEGEAVSNVNKGTAALEVWPQLGSSMAWFLIDRMSPLRPLVYQTAEPVRLNSCTNPEDSHVIKNHTFLNQAYGVYNVGYFMPQAIIGSTGVE